MGTSLRFALIGAVLTVLSACNGGGTGTPSIPGGVTMDTEFVVDGGQIYELTEELPLSGQVRRAAINGSQPLFVKGVDYAPMPVGVTYNGDPLGDSNRGVWSRDLENIRAMGANAIHVYNAQPPAPGDKVGTISKFMDAAWNGGVHPIYVLLSFPVDPSAFENQGAVNDVGEQYYRMAKVYARFPALLGISIGNELGTGTPGASSPSNPNAPPPSAKSAAWWSGFNTVVKRAKQGFIDAQAVKIVTVSEVDGVVIDKRVVPQIEYEAPIYYGQLNNVAVDAWGINVYRGRSFTQFFKQSAAANGSQRAVLVTEYGAPASYHPQQGATYTITPPIASCQYPKPAGSDPNDVAEMPGPVANDLIDYVQNSETELYNNAQQKLVAGGFYFEWSDEWYKAPDSNNGNLHVATRSGGTVVQNVSFPGCYNDEAWYGLNAVSRNPSGGPDVLKQRPAYAALQALFTKQ